MSRRRRYGYGAHVEPAGCVCDQRSDASAAVHTRPHRGAGAHMNPACPHSELRPTTRPRERRAKPTPLPRGKG